MKKSAALLVIFILAFAISACHPPPRPPRPPEPPRHPRSQVIDHLKNSKNQNLVKKKIDENFV